MRSAKRHPLAFGILLLALLAAAPPVRSSEGPQVVGLPPDFDPASPTRPYDGPHPSRLDRPADSYVFPIPLGEVGPAESLFAGPRQYPLICDTEASGLGPPLADNRAGIGTAMGGGGFSKDCLAPTQAWYYYKPRGKSEFERWSAAARDVETIERDGRQLPFIVRVEMGTINRFIYALVALKGADESLAAPSPASWNGRLIYQFSGGVGIGHRQGKLRIAKLLRDRAGELARGYALVASTGTTTENHYNIWLAEDTALRVKRQFVALYGEPLYTIGVGGSGGAIQQYLLAQNRPGLIDAAIAQYSYPDMITQTIPVFDCELLEHYFDVGDESNALWRKAEQRAWIEGFNADNRRRPNEKIRKVEMVNQMAYEARGESAPRFQGQTECVAAWRGLTPLVLNPRFMHFSDRVADAVYRRVRWSYFEDLKDFFGTDERGFARLPWDNVGVQYGLDALRRGRIDSAQFLDLNARVGSWKTPAAMQAEHFWVLQGGESGLREFSPWSAHNMNLGDRAGSPAPRFAGDTAAIAAAYRSGQVFLGKLEIPVIDTRHYLDPELDMHHAAGSFSARARLIAGQGHADNQAIWISDRRHDSTPEAFAALEQWWRARQAQPERGWAATRPPSASDRCFDAQGKVLFSGDAVWDGEWNQRPAGACMRVYPIFANPRQIAGAPIAGDHFKCALQSVATAIAAGVYAPLDMRPHQARLEAIFPQGVCDYRQIDAGRPAELP